MHLLTLDDPRCRPHDDLAAARAAVGATPPGPFTEQVLSLIEAHGSAIAQRSCRPGHLTGSAMVVDAEAERVLLLLHAKLGRWLQPGGHADGDMNLAHVGLREATEETGIAGLAVLPDPLDLDVHEVHPPREDAHLHLDVRFLVFAPPGADAVLNHESRGARWVRWADLAAIGVDEGLLRLADRARDVLDVTA